MGAEPSVIACRQHDLQEIRRLLGSSGLGREARSLGSYQLAEPSPDLRKSAVQTTISRESDEPPCRKQREQPAICCCAESHSAALQRVRHIAKSRGAAVADDLTFEITYSSRSQRDDPGQSLASNSKAKACAGRRRALRVTHGFWPINALRSSNSYQFS
jgi:hypothetical protein